MMVEGRAGQFRALMRSPALRRVLGAYFIFSSAELATWVAILVWAYDVGGAPAAGLIAVVQLVPATLLAPFLAQIGDRLRRDRALSLGFAIQASAFLATAAALTFDSPPLLVYVAATLAAIGITMTRPVHYATLPDISETPGQLTAANSLSSSGEGFGAFGGPLITAGLLAISGPGAVFWLAGAASAFAALMTLSLPLRDRRLRIERPSVIESALEGFAALKQSEGTGRISFIFGAQFLVIGALDILTVVLGLELLALDLSGPGTLASALGIGGLLGAAGTAILVNRRRMAPAVAGGLIAIGLPLALISLTSHGLTTSLLFLAMAGVGKSFVDVGGRTLLQRITPDRVLARVFGFQEAMLMGGVAVGAAVAPILVRWLGGRGAFLIVGALVVGIGLSQWRPLLRLDARSVLPGPGCELLLAIPMFSVLEQSVVERLSRDLVRVEVPAGRAVMREGEAGDRFYVIESGMVSILKRDASAVEPSEVNRLGRGSFFGETALVRDIPRTATVAAVTDLVLYALERRPFLEAVTRSPLSVVEAERVIDLRAKNAEPQMSGNQMPEAGISETGGNLNAESGDKSQ
jgi:MFS family permease